MNAVLLEDWHAYSTPAAKVDRLPKVRQLKNTRLPNIFIFTVFIRILTSFALKSRIRYRPEKDR